MKRAFTLVELIVIVVISSILASGTYVFMQQMLKRAIVADFITQKSLQTQAAIDQLAYMLKARVVNSTINYDNSGTFDLLDLNASERTILQWIGEEIDLKYGGTYSGFIDLDASTQRFLRAMDFNVTNPTDYAVIFSGNNDYGEGDYTQYGWHGMSADIKVYDIVDSNTTHIELDVINPPNTHYEKFYLVKSGYAVARGEDLDENIFDNNCDIDTALLSNFTNTLFLFYDFQPWNGETFCADSNLNGQIRSGKATVLLDEVSAFEAKYDGVSMVVQIQAEMDNRNKSDNNITITKTKAVF
jgi:type II secretory pathway pseudopilin PulG